MRQTFIAFIVVLSLGILGTSSGKSLAPRTPAQAPVASQPMVSHEVHHDVSPPLREMARMAPHAQPEAAGEPDEAVQKGGTTSAKGARATAAQDPAQQFTAGPPVGTIAGLNFEGLDINQGDAFVVPDTNGTAGQTQYVEWVNLQYAVFDKLTGNMTLGPLPGNSFFTGFGGACETSNNGDPIAQYDKLANRWVMQQREGTVTNGQLGGPFFLCVAVSTTADATGSYNRYSFALPTSFGQIQNPFPDYAKLGVWPDAYYSTMDLQDPSTFLPVVEYVCALDRNAMLAGTTATSVCLEPTDTTEVNFLPADVDGFTPPAAGTPNYMMNLDVGATNKVNLWQFHVDFVNTANSTLTGPTVIPVPAFTEACGGGGECIVEPGQGLGLDSLSDRLMYRLAYRNFGDHESLVVNHTVAVNANVIGVRWYEIRNPGGTPVVFQTGSFAPDGNDRWMGSIAMDLAGDAALGYSVSGLTQNPSIRYTGRTPSDALGTMEAEQSIKEGNGVQLESNRWGDYSSMVLDPVDDCTFWYANQYLPSNGTFNWNTRVASFRFPGCGNAQANLTPTSVDFGNVVVGESSMQPVTVANGGTTPLNIIAVAVTGDFTESDDCVSSSPIAAGGSCTITVTYSPTTLGSASGTLTITDNVPSANSTQTAAVTGNGTGPLAMISPTALTFAGQLVTSTSAAQTVTISNPSDVALTISSITFSGTNMADFAESDSCGGTVAANGSCVLNITFTPSSPPSSESATLNIADDAAQSPQMVTLAGTGTDFSVGAASGGSTSATVTAGGTASYSLEVSGISGFTGAVNLSCSGAPAHSTCSVPSSVTVTDSGPATFTATITTTANGMITPPARPFDGVRGWPLLITGLVMGLMAMLWWLSQRLKIVSRRAIRAGMGASVVFGTLMWLAACSGGGGGGGGGGGSGTPPGTYSVTISATAGGSVTHPLGLTLTVQ